MTIPPILSRFACRLNYLSRRSALVVRCWRLQIDRCTSSDWMQFSIVFKRVITYVLWSDSDVYWPAQLCCVSLQWPFTSITRTNGVFVQAPAQHPPVPAPTFLPWSLFDHAGYSVWSHDYVCRPIWSFCSCLSCFMFFSCFCVLLTLCVVVFIFSDILLLYSAV